MSKNSPRPLRRMSRGRGRPRKPDKQKELEGTLRKDREQKSIDLALLKKMPPPPPDLNEKAQEAWITICTILTEYGILGEMDLFLLHAAINELNEYWELDAIIKEQGRLLYSEKGTPIANPMMAYRSNALKNFQSISIDFGLTPAGRAKLAMGITAAVKSGKDAMSEVMKM